MERFLRVVQKNRHLTTEEMMEAATLLFDEETDPQQMKDFLIALSLKGETAYEVAALATVMKSFALDVGFPPGEYMDNCGTGGDDSGSFNISTTSAFVLAGAGVAVAKHGNRKVSSKAGSHDVLEALGIRSDFTLEETAALAEQEGIAFLYAPVVHPKLKRISLVRQQIGKPTIFNLVGPLTNPTELKSQFTGINRRDFIMEYASVLRMLGRERAIVVSGADGMDEASLSGQNAFVLLDKGDLIPFSLTAEDVGLQPATSASIKGGDAAENALIIRAVLSGRRGPHFDTVVFNAGIGLFANGRASTIQEGIQQAEDSILSGNALRKLDAVVAFSNSVEKEVVAK